MTHTERLFDLILERSFLERDVVLSSGERSTYYIDGKMVEVHPESAYLIGEVIYDRIRDLKVDAIGGLAIGAVPLVTSAVISCWHHELRMEGFWVREREKTHGTQKLIEGSLPSMARVAIIDDVITSGRSAMKAIEAAEERGAKIATIIALVDREQGASELFASRGYHYDPIFTKQELFDRKCHSLANNSQNY
jgi:orotate phosphoribosyltransferase